MLHAFSVDFADPLNSMFKKADPFSASATLRTVRNNFLLSVFFLEMTLKLNLMSKLCETNTWQKISTEFTKLYRQTPVRSAHCLDHTLRTQKTFLAQNEKAPIHWFEARVGFTLLMKNAYTSALYMNVCVYMYLHVVIRMSDRNLEVALCKSSLRCGWLQLRPHFLGNLLTTHCPDPLPPTATTTHSVQVRGLCSTFTIRILSHFRRTLCWSLMS